MASNTKDMDRIIKFRAWDKEAESMLYSDAGDDQAIWQLNWDGIAVLTLQTVDSMPGGLYHEQKEDYIQADIDLMQYTGLKDKNGKEIYEGDIVKETIWNYEYDEIDNPSVEKEIDRVSVIEYRDHGFWVSDESFGWEGESLWNWQRLEVIGNIYENPTLFSVAKPLAKNG